MSKILPIHAWSVKYILAFNWIGMPTKDYGFSNGAKATLLAPSFDAASFGYDGEGILSITIDIVYRKLMQ